MHICFIVMRWCVARFVTLAMLSWDPEIELNYFYWERRFE